MEGVRSLDLSWKLRLLYLANENHKCWQSDLAYGGVRRPLSYRWHGKPHQSLRPITIIDADPLFGFSSLEFCFLQSRKTQARSFLLEYFYALCKCILHSRITYHNTPTKLSGTGPETVINVAFEEGDGLILP